jgi:hypothetical protein
MITKQDILEGIKEEVEEAVDQIVEKQLKVLRGNTDELIEYIIGGFLMGLNKDGTLYLDNCEVDLKSYDPRQLFDQLFGIGYGLDDEDYIEDRRKFLTAIRTFINNLLDEEETKLRKLLDYLSIGGDPMPCGGKKGKKGKGKGK